MATISLSLPSDGQTIDAADVNTPFNTISAVINGNLDNDNIKTNANIDGAKILANSIPPTAGDANFRGGWNTGILATPNTVTNNGNRSYSLVLNATDLTSTLSAGMRLRTTRTVAAPTQSASLNGTTQSFSNAAPAGMTFTNNFVVSAWVKLSSYAACHIKSRFNGTSGWYLGLNVSGQFFMYGHSAGAANFRGVTSSQSLPLNKWVFVTAQLDMSGFTATPTTCYLMIDGVDAPASVVTGGTNPTALIQAGNLEVGSSNAGTNLFPGKIAQAFVTSAKLTQTQVKAIYSQGITSADTTTYNMASAFSLSGASGLTDLNTTNNNTLTANGSAVTTNADAPFGGQAGGTISSTLDYGIIQAISFSTNTTITVSVPEGNTIPTSSGVSALAYSTQKAPYGMPVDGGKWQYTVEIVASLVSASVSTGSTFNVGGLTSQLVNLPIGSWKYSPTVTISMIGSTSVPHDMVIALSQITTALPSLGTPESRASLYLYEDTGTVLRETISKSNIPFVVAVATQYYLVGLPGGGGTLTSGGIVGATSIGPAGLLTFDNSYL